MPNASTHRDLRHRRALTLTPTARGAPTLRVASAEPPTAAQCQSAIARPRPIAVAIAHGHGLVRAGLTALLECEDDMTVVADAATAEEALAVSRRLHPDALLVDAGLPPRGGVDAARDVAAEPALRSIGVVMVTGSEDDAIMLDALRAGVRGFVSDGADRAELGHALRAVAGGGGILPPGMARRLIDEFAALPDANRPSPGQFEELTPREIEVVGLVAAGLSNREIAERLVVTAATAKTHVSRALRKVDARDRAQLVSFAYETGLVVPKPSAAPPMHAVA
jgi:DNA-binding NarL/FixJ family response regulator